MEIEADLHTHKDEGVTEESTPFDHGKRQRGRSRTRLGYVRVGPLCSQQRRAHAPARLECPLKRSR